MPTRDAETPIRRNFLSPHLLNTGKKQVAGGVTADHFPKNENFTN